ncbi:MAG TPA: hypothetical protein VM165_16015 [Planctomycetaceae bacterium]|nr:hypothetical protein [Planctomycetaceae bacterium]
MRSRPRCLTAFVDEGDQERRIIDAAGREIRRRYAGVFDEDLLPRAVLDIRLVQRLHLDLPATLAVGRSDIFRVQPLAHPASDAVLPDGIPGQRDRPRDGGPALFGETSIGLAGIADHLLDRLLTGVERKLAKGIVGMAPNLGQHFHKGFLPVCRGRATQTSIRRRTG